MVQAFKYAALAYMNGGICIALNSTNSLYVLLVSMFAFREGVTIGQFIGAFVMVASVIIVSAFDTTEYLEVIKEIQVNRRDIITSELAQFKLYTILLSLGSAFFFGTQLLILKKLVRSGVDNFMTAFSFLYFCSIVGFVCLLFLLFFQIETFDDQFLSNYISSIFSGIFLSSGMVCLNIASSYGNPGLCNAITNAQVILVALINRLIFKQPLNII